jgi:uncharacterized protein
MRMIDPSAPLTEAASPPTERLTDGQPAALARTDYESPDGRFSVGVWTCTPGRWRIAYDENEYCRILSGRGAVIAEDGSVRPIGPGDEFVIPAGFTGEWLVEETMTKTWVIALP